MIIHLLLQFKSKFWLGLAVFVLSFNTHAQLGFCGGNSGDPIFTENFGTAPSAATQHVPLSSSQTNYTFLGTNPSINDFGDGKYTVTNFNYNQWDWFNEPDHTIGDTNGRMLVVNASFTPGEFYRTTITGLCENTTYEFSAWLKNLTPRNSTNGAQILRPCNVKFEIWNSTNTVLLKSGSTGDFFGSLSTENGKWIESALVFQSQVGQNSVILKMVNNGVGGFGNDVAIDDIVFKTCGDFIAISDSSGNKNISICSAQTPYNSAFKVTPDNSVFSTHFYQWETSTNGVDWTNISGETNQNITVSGITTTSYYRTKVAESVVNLNNTSCNVVSDVFKVTVNTPPAKPSKVNCWDNFEFDAPTCSWINNGTQAAQPSKVNCWDNYQFNTTSCSWVNNGTQDIQPTKVNCWDNFQFDASSCSWVNNGTQDPKPANVACTDNYQFDTTSCAWVNKGSSNTKPTLKCWETANFNIHTCEWEITSIPPTQLIKSVVSEKQNIIVNTTNIANFEYSLDGIKFQSSNIFINIPAGTYTISVKLANCSESVTAKHQHLYIPKFFTPNGDNVNETFKIEGIENFSSSEVSIFDRFGKLLITTKNTNFKWNGYYDNAILPTSDYWYLIVIEGQRHAGHFMLLRN